MNHITWLLFLGLLSASTFGTIIGCLLVLEGVF